MPIPSLPREVLDQICAEVCRETEGQDRTKTLHSLTVASRKFYQICVPHLYADIDADHLKAALDLARTLKASPELGTYISKAVVNGRRVVDSRRLALTWGSRSPLIYEPTSLDLLLRLCPNIEKLHVETTIDVWVSEEASVLYHTQLKDLTIYAEMGMDQDEFTALMEHCPNLERLDYSDRSENTSNDIVLASPATIAVALRTCQKTLRSLSLGFVHNPIWHTSHDQPIEDLRQFEKLERLEISDHDTCPDSNLPPSLKTLNLDLSLSMSDHQARSSASGLRQILPNLQQVRFSYPDWESYIETWP